MSVHRIQPGASPAFPDRIRPRGDGLVALGGRLSSATLLEAYSKGVFPWSGRHPIPWYSPDPRLILFPDQLHVSRSLARTLRRTPYTVRFDTCFGAVMRRCAQIERPGQRGSWITPNMIDAYTRLHREGVAHSVEVFDAEGELRGGLYGVTLGAVFFGESMFAARADTSKLALLALCRRLEARGFAFVDCQQVTDHMLRMGGVPIPLDDFQRRLAAALAGPDRWGRPLSDSG